MRMNRHKKLLIVAMAVGVTGLTSCTKDPNSPGYEYMPDMYRSRSVEAYVDYSNMDVQSARVPANGTIPFSEDAAKAIFNFPYALPNTPEGYEMSAAVKNPIPYSDEVKEEGKRIFTQFCVHCHGEKGDGQGTIVQRGKISGVPAYNSGAVKELPEGKMFHSITYGKGLMGSHASQLNKEERWKLVHYVRFLQNDGKAPVENPTVASDSTKTE